MFLDKRMQRFHFDIVKTSVLRYPPPISVYPTLLFWSLTAEDCRMHVIMHNVYGLENNVLN
jgi:hypothetical protein